jgi:hypothetical protein
VSAAGVVDFDIKPFALQDINAVFAVRYLLDEQDRISDSGSASYEDRATWEEELFISTRSYVYHPGFLNIDFGIGPKLVQQQFETGAGANRNNETFVNLNARLNFLQLKSYNFSLFFEKDNPSVTTGLAGRFITEREAYGLNAMLYQAGRTRVRLDAARRESEGEGFDRIQDEQLDHGQLSVSTSYGDNNTIKLLQRFEDRESASGSIGLPIQETSTRNKFTELRTKNFFGSAGRHWVSQFYRMRKQDLVVSDTTRTDNQDYDIAIDLSHNESLRSRFDYSFAGFEREDTDGLSHNLRASISNSFNKRFDYGFNTFYLDQEQTGFDRDSLGVGTNFSYWRPIKSGSIRVGAHATQARTDQLSETEFVEVIDEALVLIGTNSVPLANDFVEAQSVVVKNESQTQIYVEDFDYRLVVVGSVTSIQRLLGGNIQDGERVLVDYEHRTSGTAEFDTAIGSLNVGADFLKYFSAAANFQLRETKLRSGELTTPINDMETLRLSIAADFPVGARWQLGVSVSYAENREDISPSVSNALTVQAATHLWRSTRLNLSANYLKVDQERSIEDVDQVQFQLAASNRLWSRLRVGYQASYLEDDGGSLPRRVVRHRLDMQWNYRAVRFFLRATRVDESQGTTDRDYTQVTAELVRLF